jgi:hypothetical protein
LNQKHSRAALWSKTDFAVALEVGKFEVSVEFPSFGAHDIFSVSILYG